MELHEKIADVLYQQMRDFAINLNYKSETFDALSEIEKEKIREYVVDVYRVMFNHLFGTARPL